MYNFKKNKFLRKINIYFKKSGLSEKIRERAIQNKKYKNTDNLLNYLFWSDNFKNEMLYVIRLIKNGTHFSDKDKVFKLLLKHPDKTFASTLIEYGFLNKNKKDVEDSLFHFHKKVLKVVENENSEKFHVIQLIQVFESFVYNFNFKSSYNKRLFLMYISKWNRDWGVV